MSLLSELFRHYWLLLGREGGEEPERVRLRYAEFVALEREALASAGSREYWRRYLEGSARLQLPRWHGNGHGSSHADSHNNGNGDGHAAQVRQVRMARVRLGQELNQRLRESARRLDVPLKSVLLAAHLVVLRLLGGREDVLTGVVLNGRPEAEDGERVAGLFLNTLPHRQRLRGGSWRELVMKCYEAEREALEHRRYPLAQLQQERGGEELFETCFNYVHFHVYEGVVGLGGMDIVEGEAVAETNFTLAANFSLDIATRDVNLTLLYDAVEMCAEQVEAIGRYYERALEGVAGRPEGRYERECLLTEAERAQLLSGWNATKTRLPEVQDVSRLFEIQAERQPEAVALVYRDERVSYGELNRRANQLAHYLRELGVRRETKVGFCMERSVEMVVSVLAVLKAGGAYVPLDPSFPAERLSFMLDDSRASFVVTHERQAAHFNGHSARMICLDTEWEVITGKSTENPYRTISGENLAYVIYTSGSTGRPKGAEVPHRSLLGFMCGVDYVSFDSSQTLLQYSSVSWDALTLELWPALVNGARCILFAGQAASPLDLRSVIERERVTTLWITSSLFNAVVDSDPRMLSGVTQVMTGGEALSVRHVRKALEALPESRIVNGYGPSECTVFSCCYVIPREPEEGLKSIPIGRPIGDREVYVLDKQLDPVPVGVTGELYVGGDALARGYLNRPELTAEKFVPHPYSERGGARLYRTGDRGRYLPDGRIEFVGRTDHQVKLRGFRIELEEIEQVLCTHPEVEQAVVTLLEQQLEDGSSKRLVAYVVATDGVEPDLKQVKEHLRGRLPDYMIPSQYVLLERIPLNANGKVDRGALPLPDEISAELADNYVAPRTPVELELAEIWARTLGVERVGVNDNFFDLGGHSLFATTLMLRVSDAFQVKLPMHTLFDSPTVSSMTVAIVQSMLEQTDGFEGDQLFAEMERLSLGAAADPADQATGD